MVRVVAGWEGSVAGGMEEGGAGLTVVMASLARRLRQLLLCA